MKFSLLVFSCLLCNLLCAQPDSPMAKEVIALLSQDRVADARALVDKEIHVFESQSQSDSLAQFVYLLGLIECRENDNDETPQSDLLFDQHISMLSNPYSKYQMAIGRVQLELDKGSVAFASDLVNKARNWAIESADLQARVTAEYYSSDCCLKRGEVDCMEVHARAARKIIESNPEIQFSVSTRVWNLMAATMYFKSIPDSAIYFWEEAIDNVALLPDLPENKYYLPAMLKGNLSLVRSNQGEFFEASLLLEESLVLYKTFMDNTKNHPLEGRVIKGISLAYNNLTALYHNVGDFSQANAIAKVQYKHAKEHLKPCDNEYNAAIIGLSGTLSGAHELDVAMSYLREAEMAIENCEEKNLNSLAQLQFTLGGLLYRLGEIEESTIAFQKADSLYNVSFPGEYSWNRFYTAMNLSIILSEGGRKDEAISLATELYDRFSASEDGNDFFASSFLLTLARITLDQNEPAACVKWATKGIDIYDGKEQENVMSSVLYETEKAKLITLRTWAKYNLTQDKDKDFLLDLLSEMEVGIGVLEKRKSILNSPESVNDLMEINQETFNLVKKLYHDLYTITGQDKYLRQLVSLHESALYGRIRSRLNTKKTMRVSGVPEEVMNRERALRQKLNENLNEENIIDFNEHTVEWTRFLDSLKTTYPKYHKMRYAQIEQPMDEVMSQVPAETTVVRYIQLGEKFFALVLTRGKGELFPLEFDPELNQIEELKKVLFNQKKSAEILHQIYLDVWNPFEHLVQTENVVIIPDGPLFNLSFESLLTVPPQGKENPWKDALLFKHFISYNFSLLLLSDNGGSKGDYEDLASFVPEFNDEMKAAYRSADYDSTRIEDGYLTLLSQPFAFSFAQELNERYKGDAYLNTECTEQNFVTHAGGNKVIFIGTHAESDNINPEMSRFIFAKNKQGEDNSLYSYEIYNCDLSSELAVLTACETAKPSYQPGEGMVSLAHAFNYAGSMSLLTSLWKIDEQTSINQVTSFYNYLEAGHSKPKALTLAKRDYIASKDADQLAPGYWSGLILMGDVSPVSLSANDSSPQLWIYLIGVLILGLIVLFIRRASSVQA